MVRSGAGRSPPGGVLHLAQRGAADVYVTAVVRREPLAEQAHVTGVAPATPESECAAPSVMIKDYGGGMADQEDWTPGDVASMVANPFYAITIDEGLALPHEPLISGDDWVRANVGLIEELGPEAYLRNLLSVLKGNYPRS